MAEDFENEITNDTILEEDDSIEHLGEGEGRENDNEEGHVSVSMETKWMIICFFLLVMLAYLFAGALVFHALERPAALKASKNFHGALQRLSSDNDCMEDGDVADLMMIVTRAIGEGGYSTGQPYAFHLSEGTINDTYYTHPWSTSQTFFFVITVVTTIGFGYASPHTGLGEIFCVFYALAGILLTGSIVFLVGQMLQDLCLTRFTTSRQKCLRCCTKVGAGFVNLTLAYLFVLLMVVPPSIIYFFTQEDWDFVDSLYYVVQATTTVGFGDLEAAFEGVSIVKLYIIRIIVFANLFVCLGVVSTFIDSFRDIQKLGFMTISSRISRYTEKISARHQDEKTGSNVELETLEVKGCSCSNGNDQLGEG
nr:potassium channel subfamily K member 4-like [Lytechinus pictus]